MDYKIQNVAAESIVEVVEGIYYSGKKGFTIEEAEAYINKKSSYTRRALNMGEQLGLIKKEKEKYYFLGENVELIRAKKSDRYIIFRKYLQRYDPFILFLALIVKGNAIEEAIRKIKVIYKISVNEKEIRFAFLNWGQHSKIFDYDKDKNEISLKIEMDELPVLYLKELIESLNAEVKTKIYIAEKLTELVYGFLESEEIDYLTKALINHEKDPRNSIDDAGRAFEDFLRRIGAENGHNVSKISGISQLAQVLGGSNAGLIHTKHLHICMGLGALRVAAAHSKDKTTMESWKINPDLALETILLIISVTRSIYYYVYENKQIL